MEIEGYRGKEPFARRLVVIFSCHSCRTILAWGPQTIYLFEGGVRGIIGGNRGCRGKRGKKGGKICIP
nr:MAG TPA_asm: Kinetochore protein mis18, centromere assembly, CELL CYCLE.6A [Caudoviricetes sp.]